MADVWQSERLIYRAVEESDEAFVTSLAQDPEAFLNSFLELPTPRRNKYGQSYREYLEKCYLSAIICLRPGASSTSSSSAETTKPIPVGLVSLKGIAPHMAHHRCTDMGIDISRQYQGRGYGSEAIRWTLRWAFEYGNLHRVELSAFEWNEGARRLYERLGFVPEGRRRKALFYKGRYWDMVEMGMLAEEWRAREAVEGDVVSV
ncbi:putative gnat family protein [Teratosphaeria destructans]|uniref:Gnat family protein n=1 Tax=Teratosphaeria destructans TaxID=418781 RepID=A0A9W7W4U5_9PEZI|nr:putative gnat family protein [Teratosphaeria destructans]